MKKVLFILTLLLSFIGHSQSFGSDTGGQSLDKSKKVDFIKSSFPLLSMLCEEPPTGGLKTPTEKKFNLEFPANEIQSVKIKPGCKLRQELQHLTDGGDQGGQGQQLPKLPKGLDIS